MQITETDPRTNRPRYVKVPIFIRYQRILDLEHKMSKEKWAEYKEELFGTNTEVFSVEAYDEIAIIKGLGVDFAQWEEYDIDLQAKLIAQTQLSTVVEIVRRHDQLQAQVKKKLEQKAASNQNGASKPGKKAKKAATRTRFK